MFDDVSTDGAATRPAPRMQIPLWLSALWGVSPAAILLLCVMVNGREWEWLSWVGFLAGVMNMFVFSAAHLYARTRADWIVISVPMALVMIVLNAAMLMAGDWLLSLAGLMPPAAANPAP